MIEINKDGEITRFGDFLRTEKGKFIRKDKQGKTILVKFAGLEVDDYTIDDSIEGIINSHFIFAKP